MTVGRIVTLGRSDGVMRIASAGRRSEGTLLGSCSRNFRTVPLGCLYGQSRPEQVHPGESFRSIFFKFGPVRQIPHIRIVWVTPPVFLFRQGARQLESD